jgi:Trk K+ transport system NAD-binding subunit
LRPVFRPPDAASPDEELDALADDDDAAELDELEELELQAAKATVAATGRASASHVARLFAISLYPFNFGWSLLS